MNVSIFGTLLACDICILLHIFTKERRKKEQYMDFLNMSNRPIVPISELAEETKQCLKLPLARIPLVHLLNPLGSGFFGVAWTCRLSAASSSLCAAKAPRFDCPLGAKRAQHELLRDARNAAVLPRHPALCKIMYWCFQDGVALTVWELVPTSWKPMQLLQQEHYTNAAAPHLIASLKSLKGALVHLSGCGFPLWDCHAGDVMVEDTGCTKVLDWSGGPSSHSGNSSLLPRVFHCGPVPREELLTQLGDSRAVQMVNRHVLGFYVMAVCLAFESHLLNPLPFFLLPALRA